MISIDYDKKSLKKIHSIKNKYINIIFDLENNFEDKKKIKNNIWGGKNIFDGEN